MTTAEEKADAYLSAFLAEYPEFTLMEGGWSDDALRTAYAAGYRAAEHYRALLLRAIRNARPAS